MLKKYVLNKIQKYVKKYFLKHPEVKLVVVAGSVGKTSTKRALAHLLSQKYRVRMLEGNHNSEFSVPLAILGINYPANIRNPFAWLTVFKGARLRIKQPTDVDIIVQELGTDHPGDIDAFGTYLVPDLALVTAVTPEHMEFFNSIEDVAKEEMGVINYSKFALINRDDIDGRFAEFATNANFSTYGVMASAEYNFEQQEFSPDLGYTGNFISKGNLFTSGSVKVVGEHSLRPIIGAVASSIILGLSPEEITRGLSTIKPVPGRMNLLSGIDGTVIIDDTYNSSPAAASAALQTLYTFSDAPQRIAILGDMRELGKYSKEEHERIGAMCDPNLLAWVILVGAESEKYLAPVARQRGCQVHIAANAIEAGKFARSVTESGSVILVKGSQNTIYLEECVKVLCNMSEDIELVRQTPEWQKIKHSFFEQ